MSEKDFPIRVPKSVCACPYCGRALRVLSLEQVSMDEKGFYADEIHLVCVALRDEGIRRYNKSHSDMPYVYWLPASVKVEKWINKNHQRILREWWPEDKPAPGTGAEGETHETPTVSKE